MALVVYSGMVPMGLVGTPTGLKDLRGEPLMIGDIVTIFKGDYFDGTITCVVADNESHFIMGLKDASQRPDYDGWSVMRIKSCQHVINGESWPSWGFNFKEA
jgi:hypothetical protein